MGILNVGVTWGNADSPTSCDSPTGACWGTFQGYFGILDDDRDCLVGILNLRDICVAWASANSSPACDYARASWGSFSGCLGVWGREQEFIVDILKCREVCVA